MMTRGLLCGLLCLAACSETRAGLYVPLKPASWPVTWPPPTDPENYLRQRGELISLVSPEKEVKKREFPREIRKQVEALEKRRRAGKLSVEESITLGGYSLLKRQFNEAIEILTPALAREPKNFMTLANLANAYHGINEYRRAISFQEQVLINWPSRHPGWNAEQLWWYRRAEKYYLRLLNHRSREQLEMKPGDTLDPLFPAAPYARPAARYIVGGIDLKARDRMEPDALPLVEQLLVWMPHDQRLLWQFAELLNARGEIKLAWNQFKLLADSGFSPKLFRDHRSALLKANPSRSSAKATRPETPKGLANLPGMPPPGPVEQETKSWMPDWRQLSVGFGSGLLVGILAVFQFRQLTRRFSRSSPPPAHG